MSRASISGRYGRSMSKTIRFPLIETITSSEKVQKTTQSSPCSGRTETTQSLQERLTLTGGHGEYDDRDTFLPNLEEIRTLLFPAGRDSGQRNHGAAEAVVV
jgi:hypothetical protein